MSVVYVTGISGAGKSAVRHELLRRGRDAVGTDEDGIAEWVDNRTGAIVRRVGYADRTPEFIAGHDWKLDPARVEALAARAAGHVAFLCGAAANEIDVWRLFGAVVLLSVDEATMCRRVATRTTNDFGKHAHELELLRAWRATMDEDYRRYGAVIIDAARPIGAVVDDVLAVGAGVGPAPSPPAGG